MQRPIMNPEFFADPDAPEGLDSPGWLRRWVSHGLCVGRSILKVALKRPFARQDIEAVPLWYRVAAGTLYRLTVGVILGALFVVAMLTAATHPRTAVAAYSDPGMEGLYYDPASFLSPDGLRLDAWLIPALDAQRVLAQKDQALRQKQPAVILVHDFGQSRAQMLPLVRPLHDAGFLVLALSLRGCGTSASAPQTFGLREWMDVKAAADMLRRRPFVDPTRIAAVGLGTGATAVLLAAQNDPGLRTLVVQNPITGFSEALDRYVLPSGLQCSWMQTVFRWSFQAIYQADPDQCDVPAVAEDRHILYLPGGLPASPAAGAQVCQFLQTHLKLRSE